MLLIQVIFEWKVSMNQENEGKAFFKVFLQIHKWFLNPLTSKGVCLRFQFWCLQFSNHFLFLIEARNIFISFYVKSTQQPVCVHASVCFPQFTKMITNIVIIYTKEITTITITTASATTTNNKVNVYSGSGLLIQILGQDRKYKYKLKRQGWYMQTHALEW